METSSKPVRGSSVVTRERSQLLGKSLKAEVHPEGGLVLEEELAHLRDVYCSLCVANGVHGQIAPGFRNDAVKQSEYYGYQ